MYKGPGIHEGKPGPLNITRFVPGVRRGATVSAFTSRSGAWRSCISSVALLAAAAGCAGDPAGNEQPPPPSAVSAVGAWDLERVAGLSLPVPISSIGAFLLEIDAGVLEVADNRTWSLRLTLRNTVSGTIQSREDRGTWTGQGARVTLTYETGRSPCANEAEVTRTELRIAEDCQHEVEFVFARRQ